MPKTVSLSIHCEGVSASEFCSVTYCSKDFFQGYHAAVNGDDHAVIPAFERHQESLWHRIVEFTIPVKAPSVIMRMIGSASQLRVVEAQQVSKVTMEGGALREIHVESKPRPQLGSVGNGFTSDAIVKIMNNPLTKGCSVEATVEVCASSAPYGMVGLVESFMAQTAKESLDGLLQHMCSTVENLKDNNMLMEQVKKSIGDHAPLHAWLGLVSPEEKATVYEDGYEDTDSKEDEDWVPSDYQSVYYSDANEDIAEALHEITKRMDAMQKSIDVLVSLQQNKETILSLRFDSSVWWYASSMLAGALVASYFMTHKNVRQVS